MIDGVEDLYDYGDVRRLGDATMFRARVERPLIVLGSSQRQAILTGQALETMPVRRRRGGGGVVLLQPGDVWIDWWIPAHDPRWSGDVRESSLRVGRWWMEALGPLIDGFLHVHDGAVEGALAHRVVCFAGRGPGEVFVDGRKAVGLTQWRVHEGNFVSTVLAASSSAAVLDALRISPEGLAGALDHHTLSTLRIGDVDELTARLRDVSGPWSLAEHSLGV